MIENYDRNQPFLLSMHYYNVHSPNIGRKDLFAKYKAKGMTDIQANYAAQIEAVDESVGRIRKAIKELTDPDAINYENIADVKAAVAAIREYSYIFLRSRRFIFKLSTSWM